MRLLVEENPDALALALLEADELIVGWRADVRAPTFAVRSDFVTPELRASIIQGAFHNDGAPIVETHGVHSFSRSEDGDQAISTPASNLILVGPVEDVRATLDRLAQAPADPTTQSSATAVFAFAPREVWGDIAEEAIREPAFAEQVRAITMISGALQLEEDLDLSVRIALDETGDPELASEIFGLGVSRVLPQLLARVFSQDYALHLTGLIHATAADQGVLLHAEIPKQELDIWLRVLQELAAETTCESGHCSESPDRTPQDTVEAAEPATDAAPANEPTNTP